MMIVIMIKTLFGLIVGRFAHFWRAFFRSSRHISSDMVSESSRPDLVESKPLQADQSRTAVRSDMLFRTVSEHVANIWAFCLLV